MWDFLNAMQCPAWWFGQMQLQCGMFPELSSMIPWQFVWGIVLECSWDWKFWHWREKVVLIICTQHTWCWLCWLQHVDGRFIFRWWFVDVFCFRWADNCLQTKCVLFTRCWEAGLYVDWMLSALISLVVVVVVVVVVGDDNIHYHHCRRHHHHHAVICVFAL